MPFDHRQDPAADPLVSRPHRVSPPLILAGVAGACLLGAGLGLWARPAADIAREPGPPPAQAPATAPRQIEIRIDRPAQAAAPNPVAPPEPPPAPPEPLAPRAPPEGLVRVRAVAPERLADAPRPARPTAPSRRAAAETAAQAVRKIKAERAARVEAAAARIAAAADARAHGRAERRLAERKAAEHRLAEQRAAETKRARLAEAKAARAAASRLAEEKSARRLHAKAAPARTVDPALGAADRQLNRAYRQAQAAGVPSERLERQQQRWLTARANAYRQAPWAVHDIYLARIAELQDQTREASQGD